MSEPLGKAQVEISADTSKLKKGVQEAKQEVNKVAPAAKEAGEASENAFKKAGDAIKKKTDGVRSLQGAMSSLTGVITGFVGVATAAISAITILKRRHEQQTEAIRQQRRAYADLSEAITDFQSAQFGTLEEMDRAFVRLGRQIDDSKNLTVEQADKLFYELRDITRARSREIAKVQADEAIRGELDKRRQQTEAARNTRRQLESIELGLSDGLVPEDERIVERYRQLMRDIEKTVEMGLFEPGAVDEWLTRMTAAVESKKQQELQAFRDRIKEEEKAELEKGQRVARANADAMKREMERAAASIRNSFGFDFTGLDQVAAAIDRHGGRK